MNIATKTSRILAAIGVSLCLSEAVMAQLGDYDKDYTFTPVPPCRIVDTRRVVEGHFAIGEFREYFVHGDGGVTASQGGIDTGCISPVGEPRGVMLSFIAVPFSGNGTINAYPAGDIAPERGTLLSYQKETGQKIITASAAVKTKYVLNSEIDEISGLNTNKDIAVRNRRGETHLVIDVIGYYDSPNASGSVEYTSPVDKDLTSNSTSNAGGLSLAATQESSCLINASGYFLFNNDSTAECNIRSGFLTKTLSPVVATTMATGKADEISPFSMTVGVELDGVAQYHLTCSSGTGAIGVRNVTLTATCSPHVPYYQLSESP